METCRLAQQASFSFEQGLIFIAPRIDLAWGISVAEQPQGLGLSDTEELEDVGRRSGLSICLFILLADGQKRFLLLEKIKL